MSMRDESNAPFSNKQVSSDIAKRQIIHGEDRKTSIKRRTPTPIPRSKKYKVFQAEKHRAESDDGEPEEDPGHSASKQFLRVTKAWKTQQAATKNDQRVMELRRLVADREQVVQRSMKNRVKETREQQGRMQAVYALALQHNLVRRDGVEMIYVPKNMTVHPDSEKAVILLSTSKSLLEQYTTLSEQVASSDGLRLSKQGWEGDVMRMDDIIMSKDNRVKSQVLRRLDVAKSRLEEESQDAKALDPKKNAWERLISSTNGGHGDASGAEWDAQAVSWGGAARNAKKGVKRLVRYLSDE
ncbi:MAG: hypothetical protein Q9195_000696 [Heterodermia aff. obscurata]